MTNQELHYTDSGTHVHVIHEETGGRWECPIDYLPTARLRGWEPAEPEDHDLDGLFDDSSAEGEQQTGFDPAEHDVAQVSAHLARHADASPGEVLRVLELERAGKNRKTIEVPEGFDPITGD